MFVGIIPVKPPQNFTSPLGIPKGLKGLLHMLIQSSLPRKMIYVIAFIYFLFFCFANGLTKCKFWGV